MLSGRLGAAVVRVRVRESLARADVDRTANVAPASNAPRRSRRLKLISLAPPAIGTYSLSATQPQSLTTTRWAQLAMSACRISPLGHGWLNRGAPRWLGTNLA